MKVNYEGDMTCFEKFVIPGGEIIKLVFSLNIETYSNLKDRHLQKKLYAFTENLEITNRITKAKVKMFYVDLLI